MEKYLDDRLYVYRKSYKYYMRLGVTLHIGEVLFSASSLAAFALVPLAGLSLGSTFLMGLGEVLRVKQKMIEFKRCYEFYFHLYNLYMSHRITESQIYDREGEFLMKLEYFAVERYLKRRGLYGYGAGYGYEQHKT